MSEKLRKYANTLVYWRGGGYDGCMWEPNMGFVDGDAEWHPVISTGYGRIPDENLLLSAIENMEDPEGNKYMYEDLSFHPLTQEGADWFCKNVRNDYVARLLDAVNGSANAGLEMICTKCGRRFSSTDYSFGDLISVMADSGFSKGCGGIAVMTDDIWCDECRYECECASCHEIDSCITDCGHNDFSTQFFVDWLKVCECCSDIFIMENNLEGHMEEAEEKYDSAETLERRNEIINSLRDTLQTIAEEWPDWRYKDLDFNARIG